MRVLIAYGSRHGATQEIAERIAGQLSSKGHEAETKPVKETENLATYDAFVIGSAVYFGKWLKEATEFVRQNAILLSSRQVWLFSSGPLGTEASDAQGRDLLETAAPKESNELKETLDARDHRVFFGALNLGQLRFSERLVTRIPAAKSANLFPEGDFRNWDDIDAWAGRIAATISEQAAA